MGEGKILFVIGSRHPRARQQVQALQKCLPGHGLLVSAHDVPDQPGREDEIARDLAGRILEIAQTEPIAALVVVGGDTARAVAERLGITLLLVGGEVLPGIPRAIIGDGTAGRDSLDKQGGRVRQPCGPGADCGVAAVRRTIKAMITAPAGKL